MERPTTEHILNHHGIKLTPVRQLVLQHLRRLSSAVSLSEIEAAMEKSDRITLYRTLKTFENHGLVHSIDDGTGTPKYALCSDSCSPDKHEDLHLHFYCRVCENTYCLPSVQFPEFNLPESFRTEEANLVLKGVCNGCNE